MRIHKLWAENVKGITSRVSLELAPTGLSIVTAPNEMGKTTLAQVLNFIFEHKSSANSQEIKALQPNGKDVGPLMGAIIEVEGQIYKIEKQWLKDKKTEVELISPEKKALSGNAADKVIDAIFTESLDETIWKMIQVAQADFTSAISDEYGEGQRDMLRHYLSEAVSDDGGDNDETLYEKVNAEYLKWYTPGGKLAGGAGTRGREIAEKNDELRQLKAKVSDLEEKIEAASEVEAAIIVNRESQDTLKKRKQAQDANKELGAAQHELKTRADAQARINQLVETNPTIKEFSQELFDSVSSDYGLYVQYNALNSIKLTGLSDIAFELNGTVISLGKGESRDQKLESPLNITLPNLLSIEYESGTSSADGLAESAKRYIGNLKKMGCETFQAAQELSRQYNEYQNLLQNLDALISIYDVETLQSAISRNERIKMNLTDWDTDIAADPVTAADLEEVAHQVGQKEGRSEEISRNGWHTDLEETREKILEYEKRIERLNREANAARLLRETLDHHKSSAEKDYSIHFSKFINELAKSYYGDDVHFAVSDSFEITSRRIGATTVEIKDLSTGAKEQLAILVRMALTQIVQIGEAFPMILDDEFAHSDPERIAQMGSVFKDFGDEQQFILFTCDPERFASFEDANRIDLAVLRGV